MNKKPKMLLIVGAFSLFIIIGLFWMSSKQPRKSLPQNTEKQKLFDVASGDTNNEVLRTILAKQQHLQNENQKLLDENQQLKNKGFQNLQKNVKEARQKIEQELSQTKSLLEQKIAGQQEELTSIQKKGKSKQGGFQVNGASSGYSVNQKGVIGDIPDLSRSLSQNNNNDDQLLKNTDSPFLPSDSKETNQTGSKDDQKIPYYTIPANSTLNNAVLMSSIIGEVPISGRLVSPAFPFKAIVGKKELFAANGMSLPPDIAGMVLEGYSVGNMTMSCARAYVTRALFVFNDGHFMVYPDKDQNQGATDLYPKNSLGYLSDPYGNTCISGKYITDAPKVLGSIIAITTAGGIGEAVAEAQTSTMTDASQSTSIISGDVGKYAAGEALGNASQQVLNWYLNRVGDVFDAVYIPDTVNHQPRELVFNVTNTIPIDLDKKGRTLKYENFQKLSAINTSLD